MDLYNFRRQYQSGGLRREDLASDPIVQFEQWLRETMSLDTPDPTAMVVATVDAQQQPSQRIVLLKKVDQQGFVFFTNRDSTKGQDIALNSSVSLHFPWYFISRQVSVKGEVVLTTAEEDKAYFSSRPQQSQWAAWASAQSQPLESRQELLNSFEAKKTEYPDEVPLPEFWGGYRVVPKQIEFWQGCENRLHDRFIYRLNDDAGDSESKDRHWDIQRCSP